VVTVRGVTDVIVTAGRGPGRRWFARITAEHAEAIRDFPELVRHGPFGRLLVAQASRAGLRLLSADQVLLGLGRDCIVDARQ
jgi:PIN domain nuclease of toxin-antitoxin system